MSLTELDNPAPVLGRPSKYRPEYAEIAANYCRRGATDSDLADLLGVTTVTIWRWQAQFEDFCNALKLGKEVADDIVERSLYQRAKGYAFDSEKVMQYEGEIIRAATREHCPPDPTSMIFWLKNRRPDRWRP